MVAVMGGEYFTPLPVVFCRYISAVDKNTCTNPLYSVSSRVYTTDAAVSSVFAVEMGFGGVGRVLTSTIVLLPPDAITIMFVAAIST